MPLHRERGRILAVPDGNELREDADGDLGGRDRADVQTDRGVYAPETLARHALSLERLEDARHLGAAADQPEVAQVAGGEGAQRLEVMGVAARDDDGVGARWQLGAMQPGADIVHFDRLRAGEAFRVREL